jgi:peptidyl-prolyl cis-trans isomerase C
MGMMDFRKLVLVAVATIGIGLAGPAAAQIYGTAARVNGVEISNLRLERHFDEYVKGKGRNITKMINPKVYKKLKKEALDQLIDRELLWQAAKEKKTVASDADVKAAMARFRQEFKTEELYRRKLENAELTEQEYAEVVRQELSGRMYLDKAIPVPEVSDEEIAAAYRENAHRFVRQESVKARHILTRVDPGADAKAKEEARARAASILADVRKGEDFALLAERYSEDATARGSGGDLGEFGRGKMVKPFDDAVFAMKPGEVSEIVETEFGFHVIKLEAYTPAGQQPLDEVKDKIRAAIVAQKRNEAARKHVEELRALAKIEIFVRLEDNN